MTLPETVSDPDWPYMTTVGFEPIPFRNGALSHRLRPLGPSVLNMQSKMEYVGKGWCSGILESVRQQIIVNVPPGKLELPTLRLTASHSNHLGYGSSCWCILLAVVLEHIWLICVMWMPRCRKHCGAKVHDPPRTRTWNLRLRRPTPYPLGQRAK